MELISKVASRSIVVNRRPLGTLRASALRPLSDRSKFSLYKNHFAGRAARIYSRERDARKLRCLILSSVLNISFGVPLFFLISRLNNKASSTPIKSYARRSSSMFNVQLSQRERRSAHRYAETNRAKNATPGQGLPRGPHMITVKAGARPGVNLHISAARVISF